MWLESHASSITKFLFIYLRFSDYNFLFSVYNSFTFFPTPWLWDNTDTYSTGPFWRLHELMSLKLSKRPDT